jgi:hypothetical protein
VVAASWIAEQGAGTAHHVLDAHGPGPAGRPHAAGLCGRVFLPAALAAPLGRPCPLCSAALDLAVRPRPRAAGGAPTPPPGPAPCSRPSLYIGT